MNNLPLRYTEVFWMNLRKEGGVRYNHNLKKVADHAGFCWTNVSCNVYCSVHLSIYFRKLNEVRKSSHIIVNSF